MKGSCHITMEEDNKIEHDKAEPSPFSLALANPMRRKNRNGWRNFFFFFFFFFL